MIILNLLTFKYCRVQEKPIPLRLEINHYILFANILINQIDNDNNQQET